MSADLENYLTTWKVVNDKIIIQDISAEINNFISLSENMVMTNHSSSTYFLVDFQFEYNNALKFLVIKINQDFITSLEKQHCFFISDVTREFKIKIIPNLVETLLVDWLNYPGN
jgi:hypothetical protein